MNGCGVGCSNRVVCLLAMLVASAVITGCKLEIDVPPGGHVVSESGSFTSVVAVPSAFVTTEPSQNARGRKSCRTFSRPPPPPASAPFGVSTRRDTMRCRLSAVITCNAFA